MSAKIEAQSSEAVAMLKTIEVVFDGKVFVPTRPLNLPAGTRASIDVEEHGYPGPCAGAPDPNRKFSPEEEAMWIEFMRAVRSSPPDPQTFDEYLRERRGDL